jgi:hypothetical protein
MYASNVDRLFAIWQILNPDVWVQPAADTFGTYFEAPGSIDTADSGKALRYLEYFLAELIYPPSACSVPF